MSESGTVLTEAWNADELEKLKKDAAATVQRLLDEHRSVRIPKLPFALTLDRPLVMDSGTSLFVDPETVIRMKPGCGGCMIRNRRLADGRLDDIDARNGDSDLWVEGGIWEGAARAPSPNDPDVTMREMSRQILGVMFFSGVRRVTVRRATIRRGEQYGILLAGCRHFHVDEVFFDGHQKDGVHVNGPSEYGLIENLRGSCGDDFVALNAWDWDSSAVSFGAIRHILVRNIRCDHDEMRILPGVKAYRSGKRTDCPVEDCRFESVSGAYNFKLYQQPNCHNIERAEKDFSAAAGLMKGIVFSDIALEKLTVEGLAEVQLDGVFEIGADAEDVLFENIRVGVSAEELKKRGMTLVTVGPKSSTWTRGSTDPAEWCELFQPDLVVKADRLRFRNIVLNGQTCLDGRTLVGARRLSVNPDYPKTRPQGGTGYGVILSAVIEA